MRLGIGTWSYTWAVGVPGYAFPDPGPRLSALELLDRAASLGVGVVQIADNLPLERMTPAEVEAIAARAQALGLDIEVGTRGSSPGHLRQLIDIAVRLGSPIVRVVVDLGDDEPTADEVVARMLAVAPDCGPNGVRIAIENHDRFPVAVLADIVGRSGSHVGICLDTVNSLGALEGPDIVIGTLAPLAIDVHCKDVRVRRAAHMLGYSVEGAAAGDGLLDIPALLGRLRDLDRDPNIILELWTPPEATWAATIEREQAWVIRSIDYLRTLLPT